MKKDASRFSPKGVLFHRTFFTAPSYAEWWRSSKFITSLHDCPSDLKAVAFCEINSNPLNARKQASSHLWSKRGFMTARVILRAVAFWEINSNPLNARKQACSHLWSKRRFMTARVILRAVVFCEINSNLLKARKQAGSHLWIKRRFVTARVI